MSMMLPKLNVTIRTMSDVLDGSSKRYANAGNQQPYTGDTCEQNQALRVLTLQAGENATARPELNEQPAWQSPCARPGRVVPAPVVSRNLRLTAIRSFYRMVALRDPASVGIATPML